MTATRSGARFAGDASRDALGAQIAGILVGGTEICVMTTRQPNNPLHGITLEMMLRQMVDRHGWEGLARDIPINCFRIDPSLTSALKYLRKAPRAREKVEAIYARFVAGRTG